MPDVDPRPLYLLFHCPGCDAAGRAEILRDVPSWIRWEAGRLDLVCPSCGRPGPLRLDEEVDAVDATPEDWI